MESLAALHGVRVLSLIFMIVGSTLQGMRHFGLDNPDYVQAVTQRWSFQPIVAFAEFSSDVLLLTTGVLIALPTLRRLQRGEGFGAVLFAVVHRVVRMLPLYAAVLFFEWLVAPLLSDGPFWGEWDIVNENCSQYVWSNLLFVNNFVPWARTSEWQCSLTGWYIAVEMQLVILVAPPLLLLYHSSAIIGILGACVAIGASLVLGGVLVENNQLSLGPFVATGLGWGSTGGSGSGADEDYVNIYATKPYTRAPPFLVGLLLAFLWLRLESKAIERLRTDWLASRGTIAGVETYWNRHAPPPPPPRRFLSARAAYLILVVSVALLALVTFAGIGRAGAPGWTEPESFAYLTFSRTVYAVAVAGICLVCFLGRGGIIREALSLGVWQPLSRLTYASLLLHPVVIRVLYFSRTQWFRYSAPTFSQFSLSNLAITFLVSVAFYLAVEGPGIALESAGLQACGCHPASRALRRVRSRRRTPNATRGKFAVPGTDPERKRGAIGVSLLSPSRRESTRAPHAADALHEPLLG